ncbi:hypothetical protein FLONG3_5528 [Fusarium longipes]|uniref:Uncharacterized protein n=1 Tax=Fusarium longipes TaxID=694270 RepID=A0A395STY6_9HYPO|nr:hypothetical protein FLONG3_5528 [Fusarium longipes]
MGGQTGKRHHQETLKGSEENSQTEAKTDIGQSLAKGSCSKLPLSGLSKNNGGQHAPEEQRDRDEGKVDEKEVAKPGQSEEPPSGCHEVIGQTDSSRNGSSAGTPFDINDVNAGATILTLITDTCKHAGKLSIQEQEQVRDIFGQMPYLLTQEGRGQEGEGEEEQFALALQFLMAVYDNPESTNWGAIESFDHLQFVLELLEKFDSRAEAEPSEERGVFVV